MLEDLEFDDSDSPAIGLVPPGVTWDQIRDHIKIAHHHLLVPAPGGAHTGAYWTGTALARVDDLPADQDEALAEFRAYLHDHDEL